MVTPRTSSSTATQTPSSSDLRVSGEGYGLDIENEHFAVRLSRQMGQLERLVSKREHGLELYAGGKGHGEPPTIDWAHDYVEEGGSQKLRMRNWARCPNHEVVAGPVCVRVRRWGFPHSPIHPVITPSRMHLDVTYVFWSGIPLFFKEGTMEAVKDFRIEAMRDDEWVFSGYSFTDAVWIDAGGRLHEGEVPAGQQDDLHGVGFYHRQSLDALVALWLEHEVAGHDRIRHGGPPTLHYHGHGQLWSRYPADAGASLRSGAVFRQRNAYLLAPWPEREAAATVEAMRHRLLNPPAVGAEPLSPPPAPRAAGTLARAGETAETAPLKPAIRDALAEVRDEQLYDAGAGIVDLGYVRDVRVRGGTVEVVVGMPHRGRPVYDFLVSRGGGRVEDGIRERLMRIDGVERVVVRHTWNPPWTVARMTDAGRRAVGLE
jgi:metal-sulfur cluster biosynthetic enzyme